MVQNFIAKQMDCIPFNIPPRGRTASIHPNYFLLGFSAALAPKFHPYFACSQKGLAGWLGFCYYTLYCNVY